MTLKQKAQKIWESLKPHQKKKSIIFGILISIVIVASIFYKTTHQNDQSKLRQPEKKREIALERGTLEKSLFNESSKHATDMEEQMKKLKEYLRDLAEGRKPDMSDDDQLNTDLKSAIKPKPIRFPDARQIDPSGKSREYLPPDPNDPSPRSAAGSGSAPGVPIPGTVPVPGGGRGGLVNSTQGPVPGGTAARAGSASAGLPPGVPPAPGQGIASIVNGGQGAITTVRQVEVQGDIETVSQRIDKERSEGKKKELTKIYLPPSFMEATLLSGMYAPTSEGGKGSPMPALIRIKNLAILPNAVKGDLKGCFVIAEAFGSLADERAHVRLNTLSCIAKGGQSVIDQKIKGYAVDEDGFVGLRGNVVSKMGAAIARSLLAGFAVGFGDAMNASTVTTTQSGLGVVQSYDSEQATRAGVGKGISQAGKDLQKMLLDLGKQAYPVVEIGTGRKLTVVISEGADIEVKQRPNTCFGGGDRCAN